MDKALELAYLALVNELNATSLFATPNLLMKDRPEVYVLHCRRYAFVLNSGSGGVLAHAHAIVPATPPSPVDRALVYFAFESEWLHNHSSDQTLFYIAKKGGGGGGGEEFGIYDYATHAEVARNEFNAGHYHGVSIKEVVHKKPARHELKGAW